MSGVGLPELCQLRSCARRSKADQSRDHAEVATRANKSSQALHQKSFLLCMQQRLPLVAQVSSHEVEWLNHDMAMDPEQECAAWLLLG